VIGLDDGSLVTALGKDGRFLVHGLDTDRARVAAARKALQEAGVYGRASVAAHPLMSLPYADNTVNLLILNDPGAASPRDS
jgi:23S rRNA G2445 N2-methylase RlmL